MNYRYRPGLRSIKTSIAVFACLVFANFVKPDSAFMATTAAIICLQSTYSKTIATGVHRLLGTAIGGLVGFLSLEFLNSLHADQNMSYLLVIPIGLLFIMYIFNVIEKQDALGISCIVFLSIVLNYSDIVSSVSYVLNRMFDTSIGVIAAMLIDKFVMPIKE